MDKLMQRELVVTVLTILGVIYLASTGAETEVIYAIAGIGGAYAVSRGVAKINGHGKK